MRPIFPFARLRYRLRISSLTSPFSFAMHSNVADLRKRFLSSRPPIFIGEKSCDIVRTVMIVFLSQMRHIKEISWTRGLKSLEVRLSSVDFKRVENDVGRYHPCAVSDYVQNIRLTLHPRDRSRPTSSAATTAVDFHFSRLPKRSFMRIKTERSPTALYFCCMNICWPSAFPVITSVQTSKGESIVRSGFSVAPSLASIFPFSILKWQEPSTSPEKLN